jgi:hypothetical protein
VSRRDQRMQVDQLVMLLSTDWFLEHWSEIGITVRREEAAVLQQGCRDIVRQIVSGVEQYWLTSFADERVRETSLRLERLLEQSGVGPSVVSRMRQLAAGQAGGQSDEKPAWLLLEITQMLCRSSAPDRTVELSSRLREIVCRSFTLGAKAAPDFEAENLQSHSHWDEYVRRLTPDLPSSLSDYVASVVRTQGEFAAFWSHVRASSRRADRTEILNWYRRQMSVLAGKDVTLPESLAD